MCSSQVMEDTARGSAPEAVGVGALDDVADADGLLAVAAARLHGGHRARLAAQLVAGLWPADAGDATCAAVDTLGPTERVRVTQRALAGLNDTLRAAMAREATRKLDPDLLEAVADDVVARLTADRVAQVLTGTLARLGPAGRAEVAERALAAAAPKDRCALAGQAVGRLDTGGLAAVVAQAVGGLAGDGAALLAAGRATVAAMGADPLTPTAAPDDAVADTVAGLDRLERMVRGEKLRRIAELDERQAHQGRARSTADWLAPHLGLSPGEAKAETSVATAMTRLPETARQLRAGELGFGQAQQAARSLAELDRAADEGQAAAEAAARLDSHVADRGRAQTRQELRNSIDRLHHDHDPDLLAQRQRRARARRDAWFGPGPDGEVRFGGTLDPLAGAHLRSAINALARPADRHDERTPGQRRADAFTDLARRSLDAGDLPDMAAQHAHVIVITTDDGLQGAPDADASWLDGYGPVSSATARMVACDGQVTEVVVDRHGRPLKVIENGRPNRAQRRAVIARDRVCIGCGAPASRCQIHHVVWRRNGGATVVENLVLSCWACHHDIHHNGWVVERIAGRYTIRRPDRHRERDPAWRGPPGPIEPPEPPGPPEFPDRLASDAGDLQPGEASPQAVARDQLFGAAV